MDGLDRPTHGKQPCPALMGHPHLDPNIPLATPARGQAPGSNRRAPGSRCTVAHPLGTSRPSQVRARGGARPLRGRALERARRRRRVRARARHNHARAALGHSADNNTRGRPIGYLPLRSTTLSRAWARGRAQAYTPAHCGPDDLVAAGPTSAVRSSAPNSAPQTDTPPSRSGRPQGPFPR